MATALKMYASDHGGAYPFDCRNLTHGNYLKLIPTCPASGTDTYSGSYRSTVARRDSGGKVLWGEDTFFFYCKGNNHAKHGTPPNHPAYYSQSGFLAK